MEVRRTPESAFDRLPGYAFAPLDVAVDDGVRMGYLDEGGDEQAPVLLLHGLPGWSYGFRRVVPILAEAGCRVVAPDLIGCGKSDRPLAAAEHGLAAHVRWLGALLDHLGLGGVTLVAEDVGAVVALALLAERPERFARAVLVDPWLPSADAPPPAALARWVDLGRRPAAEVPSAGSLLRERCATPLSPQEVAGYDVPFGDDGPATTIAGLGGMLVAPATVAAAAPVLAALVGFAGRLAIVDADPDPVARAAADRIAAAAPGARRIAGAVTELGRRAVAEDRGPELAAAILDVVRADGPAPSPG